MGPETRTEMPLQLQPGEVVYPLIGVLHIALTRRGQRPIADGAPMVEWTSLLSQIKSNKTGPKSKQPQPPNVGLLPVTWSWRLGKPWYRSSFAVVLVFSVLGAIAFYFHEKNKQTLKIKKKGILFTGKYSRWPYIPGTGAALLNSEQDSSGFEGLALRVGKRTHGR